MIPFYIHKYRSLKFFHTTRNKSVRFYSSHPGLHQLSLDISASLGDHRIKKPINIYSGIHRSLPFHGLNKSLKIGIQTEQLCNHDGSDLTAGSRNDLLRSTIKQNIRRFDFIIDINTYNAAFYRKLHDWRAIEEKLYTGPYIFPAEARFYQKGTNGALIFFGASANNRRAEIIPTLKSKRKIDSFRKLFGTNLYSKIKPYDAVLNLHYLNGRYTEAPRLLTSYLAGKPVISEELCDSFEPKNHYLTLDQADCLDLEKTFDSFSEHVTRSFAIRPLLEQLVS